MAKHPIDKFGRDYDTLVALQERQLAQMRLVLKPEVYADLEAHCQRVNRPVDPAVLAANAASHRFRTGGLHVCPVGSELWDYILNHGVGANFIAAFFQSTLGNRPQRTDPATKRQRK